MLVLKIQPVSRNRRGSECFAAGAVAYRPVPRVEVAVDLNRIPFFGMTCIADFLVVVAAPEKGDGIELYPLTQNVLCGDLALPLRNNPVLDTNGLAGMRIGPPRNVSRSKDAWDACFEIFVHRDSTVHSQTGRLGKLHQRTHPNSRNDQIGFERSSVAEC